MKSTEPSVKTYFSDETYLYYDGPLIGICHEKKNPAQKFIFATADCGNSNHVVEDAGFKYLIYKKEFADQFIVDSEFTSSGKDYDYNTLVLTKPEDIIHVNDMDFSKDAYLLKYFSCSSDCSCQKQ